MSRVDKVALVVILLFLFLAWRERNTAEFKNAIHPFGGECK